MLFEQQNRVSCERYLHVLDLVLNLGRNVGRKSFEYAHMLSRNSFENVNRLLRYCFVGVVRTNPSTSLTGHHSRAECEGCKTLCQLLRRFLPQFYPPNFCQNRIPAFNYCWGYYSRIHRMLHFSQILSLTWDLRFLQARGSR